jgi:hypothetical protein
MVAKLIGFLRGEILFLGCLEVLIHLLHNVFCLMVVLNIKICRSPGHLVRMTALRTEFPLLEAVHIRERAAGWTPDYEVHTIEVIGVIVINKYRRFAEKPGIRQPPAPWRIGRINRLVEERRYDRRGLQSTRETWGLVEESCGFFARFGSGDPYHSETLISDGCAIEMLWKT